MNSLLALPTPMTLEIRIFNQLNPSGFTYVFLIWTVQFQVVLNSPRSDSPHLFFAKVATSDDNALWVTETYSKVWCSLYLSQLHPLVSINPSQSCIIVLVVNVVHCELTVSK